jgi:hypothetical protein
VKLKTQPRRKREVAAPAAASASPEVKAEPAVAALAVSTPAPAATGEPVDDFAARPAVQSKPPQDVPGVSPDLALYIDNRIACRLDEMFEERIKPFLEKALEQAKHNGNGHAKEEPPKSNETP